KRSVMKGMMFCGLLKSSKAEPMISKYSLPFPANAYTRAIYELSCDPIRKVGKVDSHQIID
ncbi:MAG: hypothetical protein Q7V12_01315, partial [Deltaproteobacteria bacterium]|nr:hypothetical protein [Deltaproteobacteria bacterium]